ncbi:transcription factor bHLH95-like [Mangifera indica]|uniref:transcription factor bHLH95-like n=1 Tax=Mangifera indica TaxID=29780 RepID=UPI001CFA2E7B|nr:transcription factor bHLH95-like [Mangifera indica]
MAAMPEETSLLYSFFWDDQSWPPAVSDQCNNDINTSSGGGGGGQERKKVAAAAPSGSNKMKQGGGENKESNNGGDNNKNNNNRVVKEGKGSNGGGGDSVEHEIHILTERERRKKMRNMFASLHALLPHVSPKADKCTVVDEAVKYIKTLEQTLQKLEKKKMERLQGEAPSTTDAKKQASKSREAFLADQVASSNLAIEPASKVNPTNLVSASPSPAVFKTWTSPNVVLNISGDAAQINLCSPKKLGLLTTISYIFEKYKIEVISAQVSSHSNRRIILIQAKVNRDSEQFTEAIPVEDIYKKAAGELAIWISS